ncbi:protein kinase domain-containing protein [Kribbella sp. GL6]|uniref:protein kinase domain-containing protein n=1 Tax=Kribbella sp. GL6 TaxID=3419765 RepID=UPI003D0011CC
MLIGERYRLGASLGRGGMGEVFRATDELLGREVAVKVMLRTGDDTAAAERFQREARAAARLSDAHIVAVYDFGQYDDNFYLVMELVEGRTVAGEIDEDGPVPWDRAIDIVEQAAAGLAAAHAENVVHRDIKPSNLMISAEGVVKVADFGIAALPGAETSELTMTGQIIGSPLYLSPERARGQKGGPESDVYALGCVLYQLLTGRPPFMGDHPTALLYQHVDAEPVPPSRLRPDLGGPYEGLLLRMLAKDPADRPTAAELTSIRRTAARYPALTQPTQSVQGTQPLSPTVARPTAAPTREPRKPLLIAAVAVLVLGGAVATGIVLHNTAGKNPPTVDVGPPPSPTGTPTITPTTDPTSSDSATNATRRTTNTPSSTSSTPSTTPSQTPSTPTTTPTTTPSSTPTKSTPTPTPTPTKTTTSTTPSTTPTSTPPSTTPPPTTSTTPRPSTTPTP